MVMVTETVIMMHLPIHTVLITISAIIPFMVTHIGVGPEAQVPVFGLGIILGEIGRLVTTILIQVGDGVLHVIRCITTSMILGMVITAMHMGITQTYTMAALLMDFTHLIMVATMVVITVAIMEIITTVGDITIIGKDLFMFIKITTQAQVEPQKEEPCMALVKQ